eukprot:TRINITY_DN7450_c0_g1_i1.p1 TRINITY_DN7450_c0_g1~~TRINITY_DN7450_c0_g1_i1.p1  ORF type:complete len:297 (+),score=96.48 TRINITY_DN7450_c0_g1_i1:78-893(+)
MAAAAAPLPPVPRSGDPPRAYLVYARALKDLGNSKLKATPKAARFQYKQALMQVLPLLPQRPSEDGPAAGAAMVPGGEKKMIGVRAEATDEEKAEADELACTLHNNCCQASLNIEDWDGGLKHAKEALHYGPGNVKAIYRRGCCLLKKGDLALAKKDFDFVARNSEDGPKMVKAKCAELDREWARVRAKEKKLFGNMFAKMDAEPKHADAAAPAAAAPPLLVFDTKLLEAAEAGESAARSQVEKDEAAARGSIATGRRDQPAAAAETAPAP